MNIKTIDFPDNQYIKEEYQDKKWICLHHTGSTNAKQDINWWKQTPDKIATPFIIDRDGSIYQIFDSKYFGWHLGLKDFNSALNRLYNAESIGIEIVNLGALTEKQISSKKFEYMVSNYRGSKYWQLYNDSQYQSLNELINYLLTIYPKIGKDIITSNEFDLSVFKNPCIYSHRNVHREKTDVSPAFDFNKIKIS
jgi:N-acetyl-anhydromuramyl-L-alanine amidase AmpD